MFNKNELIVDKIRSFTYHDYGTNELLFRLTSLEDPSLKCSAEGEEITDAVGSTITKLYRAKKGSFSASNSLLSLALAAQQYGTEIENGGVETKVEGTEGTSTTQKSKIIDYTYEILDVKDGETKVTLKNKPTNDIKFIYSIENNDISKTYTAGTAVDADKFVISKETGEITVPSGFTGKLFVEYQFENENALRISNKTSNFPTVGSAIIYAYFKDKCNDSIVYSGKIICPKAKLNPEQVELALTSQGKHPFEIQMLKDYCDEDAELFSIIVSE